MHKIIVIGTSAGGLHALTHITSMLPANLSATVLVVMHIGARRSLLPEILQKQCSLPVRHALDHDPLLPGQVLIAPPDRHLTVESDEGRPIARLWHGPKENYTRPAIDPLFRSAAAQFDGHVIAVILTGYLDDGTAGLYAVKACGGYAIVQDPQDAQIPDMPANALESVTVDQVLPLREIGPALATLAARPANAIVSAAAEPEKPALPEWIRIENRYVRGEAGMQELQQIGVPSGYTCPECGGALWKMSGGAPSRFRCHTGHSFSARVLSELQDQSVEAALWTSLRALQQKVRMEEEMLDGTSNGDNSAAQQKRHQRIEKLQADIATLQILLANSVPAEESMT